LPPFLERMPKTPPSARNEERCLNIVLFAIARESDSSFTAQRLIKPTAVKATARIA